ncbi:MAG TPA: 7-cyano-7-deazaguanine synthase QueC [Candidatus Acidoferrales bacterium]
MPQRKDKAVVLVSGGMDSCVTAAIAAQEHELALLHATYGQRTEARERRAFDDIADFYQVKDRLVARLDHFGEIGASALTDPSIPVPEADLSRATIPASYVPFRNAHLLAIGVSWAEALGAKQVCIGAVWEDSSGYPDCRPEYYSIFNELVRVGTRPETQLEIITPLIHMKKHEIVRRGIGLGAPLHLTWSCYQSEEEACGTCDSCALRLRAFSQAGAEDSIRYRARVGYT